MTVAFVLTALVAWCAGAFATGVVVGRACGAADQPLRGRDLVGSEPSARTDAARVVQTSRADL